MKFDEIILNMIKKIKENFLFTFNNCFFQNEIYENSQKVLEALTQIKILNVKK